MLNIPQPTVTVLEAALIYSRRGWRVFRCWSRTKVPATDHGKDDATIDLTVITAWWTAIPDSNVAIATGAASSVVVLDCDPRHGGDESLCAIAERLPETPTSLTGGGGSHQFFAHPGGTLASRHPLPGLPGLDLQADGAYVVMPPSIHPDGPRYAWNPLLDPSELPLAPLPRWLLDLARSEPTTTVAQKKYTPASWDGAIPARVAHLLRADAKIRARFRRVPGDHADQSPSGVDASLAHLLARRRLTGAEIEAALRASRAQAGLPRRADSYFRSTCGKALGGVYA